MLVGQLAPGLVAQRSGEDRALPSAQQLNGADDLLQPLARERDRDWIVTAAGDRRQSAWGPHRDGVRTGMDVGVGE